MEILSLVVSSLGLMASLWAAYEVRQLRDRFRRRQKLPEYLAALDAHTSALANTLNDFARRRIDAAGEIRELDATLEAIERVQARSNRRPVSDVRTFIQHTGTITDRRQVQETYERVRRLRRQLAYQAGEEEWT